MRLLGQPVYACVRSWRRRCVRRSTGPLPRWLTTKVHLSADGKCRPLSLVVTPASESGRPSGFDKTRYRARNTVERATGKLKQSRAVVTRYDKRGYVLLGTVTAAALLIRLRS
ncbi:hypothetical protein [Streptosporangium canum]|uniref:hypothetical protein n=1 Tax=Streptosporangium canum TaxID=324952 RepID=UPI003F4D978A